MDAQADGAEAASLQALDTLVLSHAAQLGPADIGAVLDTLPVLVCDSDLHVAHLALQLCTTVSTADECLVLHALKELIGSALTRAAVVNSLRFTLTEFASGAPIPAVLLGALRQFLATLEDDDLKVRRGELLALNCVAHNKPTKKRPELVHQVDLGPFEHTVDDGLELRKPTASELQPPCDRPEQLSSPPVVKSSASTKGAHNEQGSGFICRGFGRDVEVPESFLCRVSKPAERAQLQQAGRAQPRPAPPTPAQLERQPRQPRGRERWRLRRRELKRELKYPEAAAAARAAAAEAERRRTEAEASKARRERERDRRTKKREKKRKAKRKANAEAAAKDTAPMAEAKAARKATHAQGHAARDSADSAEQRAANKAAKKARKRQDERQQAKRRRAEPGPDGKEARKKERGRERRKLRRRRARERAAEAESGGRRERKRQQLGRSMPSAGALGKPLPPDVIKSLAIAQVAQEEQEIWRKKKGVKGHARLKPKQPAGSPPPLPPPSPPPSVDGSPPSSPRTLRLPLSQESEAEPASGDALEELAEEDLDEGVELAATSLIDCYERLVSEAARAKSAPSMLLSMSLDKWAQLYTADPARAIVDVLNLFLRVCGLPESRLDLADVDAEGEDALDELITEESLKELVDVAKKSGTFQEPYPLADKKMGKRCKGAIISLWRTLLEKTKHELLYDGLFLTSVVAMLQIMAASGHRGVRHTSTELGMETLSKLVELLVELDAQHESKSRQQTGKKKQAGSMHAEMAQDLKEIEEKQAKLHELMESIYQTIFLPRFRDTFVEIRLCCAHGFGRCVVLHKATYFDDQYLKYFGWMCNDASPLVRAAAVQQLVAIYKSAKDDLEPLENFTGRFVGRFLELAKDVDGRVTTEALKLVHVLLSLDVLPDSQQVVEITLPLMHNGDPALLKALVPLVQHRLQATDDEVAASQASAPGKKKGKSKAAADGAQAGAEQAPQQSLLRLARLLQTDAVDAGRDTRDTRVALCSNVVAAMRDEPSLSNWAAYCDLLLNAEDEDEDVQVMLLHLMGAAAASAVAASSGEAEAEDGADGTQAVTPRKRQRKGKKSTAAEDESTLQLSAQLGKSLPQLLSRFGTEREPLTAVLSLLQQLQLPAAQATLKGQRFGDLLQQLEAVCTKHTDADTLTACGQAWRSLLQQKDANAMLTKVQVGYKRLCDKLLAAVRPLGQQLRGKSPQVDFAEAEVAMLRLEKLSVQPLQPLPLLHGLAPRLVALAETAGASDEQLLGTTHSLLQLQLTQMGSAIRELDGVDSADDLQQKRMRIQKAIQELLPSLSSAVQQLPAGRVRAALFLALGSSLVLIKSSRLLFAADADLDEEDELGAAAAEAVQEAEDAAMSRLQAILRDDAEQADDGEEEDVFEELDDEDEDADAEKREKSHPEWLMRVVQYALLGGLPAGRTFSSLLARMDEARPSVQLPQLLKKFWSGPPLSKLRPEEQGAIELEILTSSFADCAAAGDSRLQSLTKVAKRLAQLQQLAKDKSRGKAVLQHVLTEGVAWAFEQHEDEGDRGKWLDVGLAHLVKNSSAETARHLSAQLAALQGANSDVLCPQFELTLKRLTQTPGQTPRGGSRTSDTSAPRQPSFGGGGSRASRATARSARGSLYEEQDSDGGEDDDEEEEEEQEEEEEDEVDAEPAGDEDANDESEEELPWDGEVAEDDEGEGEDEEELPGGTEELGAGRRRGGVYDEEEPMDESADDDDAASEAEAFSQQSTQHSQAVPAAAANAFRAKRKRA